MLLQCLSFCTGSKAIVCIRRRNMQVKQHRTIRQVRPQASLTVSSIVSRFCGSVPHFPCFYAVPLISVYKSLVRFCGLSLDFPFFIRNSLFNTQGVCYTEKDRCERSMDLQRSEAYEKITLGRDWRRRHCGSQNNSRHDAGQERRTDRRHGHQCRAG